MDKFDLLCLIEAISNFAYDIHYTAKGRNFYSDHLFSERLADIDVKDDFIETFYLGESEDAPDSAKISAKVSEITPKPSQDTQADFKKLRKMIVKALMAIENYHGTKGEEDLLGSLAHILQRHNGLLFRELSYTPEEIKNDNDEWERLITGDDVLGGELNNEKWITVHPNKENPDDYRRLKVEDGETSKEAVDRKYGKKKEKEPEKDDKKEPEKEEKKETEEKKDTESGEEDLTKLSDDELREKVREAEQKDIDYSDAKYRAIYNDPELKKLEEEKKKYSTKWLLQSFEEGENEESVKKKMDEFSVKYLKKEKDLQDAYKKEHAEEFEKIGKELAKYQNEELRRFNEKSKKSQEEKRELEEKFDKLMAKASTLSEDEFEKALDDIKEEAEKSNMINTDKTLFLRGLKNRSEITLFNKKVDNIKNKVGSYSSKTDGFIEKLNKTELATEKLVREANERNEKIQKLQEQREKTESDEQKKKINDELNDLLFSAIEASVKKDRISYKNSIDISTILKESFGDTGNQVETPLYTGSKKSFEADKYKEITTVLNGVLGKNISTKRPPKISGMRGRAYFSEGHNEIKLSKYDGTGVVIHEYVHYLEANNPKMMENSKAFLEYRTKGDSIQSLRSVTGNKGYKGNEKTKKDNFFSPYCGKLYNCLDSYITADATELMSMGVQRLFENPKEFAKEDREYFDFVIANLRGEL